jgi:hypothetical protein
MNAVYIVETVTVQGRADSVRIDWVVAYGRYLAWSASDTSLGFFDSLDAARARAQTWLAR